MEALTAWSQLHSNPCHRRKCLWSVSDEFFLCGIFGKSHRRSPHQGPFLCNAEGVYTFLVLMVAPELWSEGLEVLQSENSTAGTHLAGGRQEPSQLGPDLRTFSLSEVCQSSSKLSLNFPKDLLGRRRPLNTSCWENWVCTCGRLKQDPISHPVQEQLKMDGRLGRPKALTQRKSTGKQPRHYQRHQETQAGTETQDCTKLHSVIVSKAQGQRSG